MIKINLLPQEYRREKKSKVKHSRMALPIIGIFIILIVIFLLMLIVMVVPRFQGHTLKEIEERWNRIEEDYKTVIDLKKRQKELEFLLDNIKDVIGRRILWAKCLNTISDALPDEIQLTELVTRAEKVKDKLDRRVLVISGVVPAFPGEGAIGDFIKVLRENQDFIKDFPQIDLPTTVTEPASGFKRFTMKCYMKIIEAPVEVEKKPTEGSKKKKGDGGK